MGQSSAIIPQGAGRGWQEGGRHTELPLLWGEGGLENSPLRGDAWARREPRVAGAGSGAVPGECDGTQAQCSEHLCRARSRKAGPPGTRYRAPLGRLPGTSSSCTPTSTSTPARGFLPLHDVGLPGTCVRSAILKATSKPSFLFLGTPAGPCHLATCEVGGTVSAFSKRWLSRRFWVRMTGRY